MTGLFGDAAAQLCGIAATVLRWRPDEFWTSTPAELAMALLPQAGAAEAFDVEQLEQLRRQFPDNKG